MELVGHQGRLLHLDGTEEYSDIVFGNNCWVASLDNADRIIYSADGSTWYDSGLVGDSGREDWKVAYTQGVFLSNKFNRNYFTLLTTAMFGK
jgi:hypothetical protein